MKYRSFFILLLCIRLHADESEKIAKVTVLVREIIKEQDDARSYQKTVVALNMLDNATFKSEFCQLHTRAKILYLLSLNIDQYEQFLNRFDNEAAWQQFRATCSEQDRRHIPVSWQKQLKIVRDCYYNYYRNTWFMTLFCPAKDADIAIDIKRYKQFYHTYETYDIRIAPEVRDTKMDFQFQRKKLKLFPLFNGATEQL